MPVGKELAPLPPRLGAGQFGVSGIVNQHSRRERLGRRHWHRRAGGKRRRRRHWHRRPHWRCRRYDRSCCRRRNRPWRSGHWRGDRWHGWHRRSERHRKHGYARLGRTWHRRPGKRHWRCGERQRGTRRGRLGRIEFHLDHTRQRLVGLLVHHAGKRTDERRRMGLRARIRPHFNGSPSAAIRSGRWPRRCRALPRAPSPWRRSPMGGIPPPRLRTRRHRSGSHAYIWHEAYLQSIDQGALGQLEVASTKRTGRRRVGACPSVARRKLCHRRPWWAGSARGKAGLRACGI